MVRDVERLFPPDLEYENVEIIRCVLGKVCQRGGGHHESDCPLFEDNSHAREV